MLAPGWTDRLIRRLPVRVHRRPGLRAYSNGVDDSLDDQPRRRVYREYVAGGKLPAGYATEDGVGLHYIGTRLHEAVAMRDGARAWWVEPSPDDGYHDRAILPRRL